MAPLSEDFRFAGPGRPLYTENDRLQRLHPDRVETDWKIPNAILRGHR